MTAEETVIVRNEFFYNLQLNQFVSLFWLYQLHLAESCLIDESVIQLHHGLIGRRTMGLPLMVIIDDFPLSFLDKKAIINISIWGFHTSAVSCVLCFHHCNWFLILCLHTLYFYVGTNIASAERETMFGYRGRKITAR